MFFVKIFLSDVEHILNVLESCVLVDFRIHSEFIRKSGPRWMAAFIDDAMNFHHINTFVLCAPIENEASIADLPNFFCKHWNIFPMYRRLENSMFFNSGDDAASFLVLEESFSLSARVWFFLPMFPVG